MRKLAKAAAALTAGCMLLSTSAFAMTDNIDGTAQLVNGAFTVNIENLGAGQSTIMVLKGDTALADANESNILYINQDAIVDGKASYNVNLGADFEGTATVYAGGTNETATTLGVLSAAKAVVGLTLAADNTTLEIGQTATITPAFDPADATDKTLTWTSSNDAIATVANGVVTAVSAGTATITATTVNNKTATIDITVNAAAPAGDYFASTGEVGKATVTTKNITAANKKWWNVGLAADKYVAGSKKIKVVLDSATYTGAKTDYMVNVVDNAGNAVENVEYYYTEGNFFVILVPKAVVDAGYKFEVIAGTGANVATSVSKFGNVALPATVNTMDVSAVLKAFRGDTSILTSNALVVAADVNNDANVNTMDVSAILKRFRRDDSGITILK